MKDKPAMGAEKPIGIFFANHLESSCYHEWDIPRWKKELENAKTLGINTIWYLPIQFGERHVGEFSEDTPYWRLQCQIAEAIVEAGLKVGIYYGINDTLIDTFSAYPDWKITLGHYIDFPGQVCPSIPEAREDLLKLRERVFATLPQVDYVISPPTDLGGCSCERCAPWTNTYLQLFKEQTDMGRKYHPNLKVVVAAHGMDQHETEALRRDIRSSDWIDYVADNPRGAGKPYIKYYMAPETTMLGGWGRYGANPRLSIVVREYRIDAETMGGAVLYSEGLHDDVNRYACLKLCQDATYSAYDLALSYSEAWLNLVGGDADLMAGIILGLETVPGRIAFDAYVDPNFAPSNPDAETRLIQLIRLRKRCPSLAENYRYWLLHYRAVCECMSLSTGELNTDLIVEEARLARQTFLRLEPAYGRYLQNLNSLQRPGDAIWMWPRTFHKAWQRERQMGNGESPSTQIE